MRALAKKLPQPASEGPAPAGTAARRAAAPSAEVVVGVLLDARELAAASTAAPHPAAAVLEDFGEGPEVAARVVPVARVVVVQDAEDYSFEAAPRSAQGLRE